MPEPEGRAELPVACTLGPGDGAERLRRWLRLAAAAPRRRSPGLTIFNSWGYGRCAAQSRPGQRRRVVR